MLKVMCYILRMTWAQTITIVAPILVAIIGGLFYGNKQVEMICQRIGDLHNDMNARFASVDARFAGVDARFAIVETHMETRFTEIHQDLRELRGLLQDALRPRAS